MAYTGSSIVDYLNSVGENSSYEARKKRAAGLGINNYSGTAEQNTSMLNTLRTPAKPSAPIAPVASPATALTTKPIVKPTVPAVTPIMPVVAPSTTPVSLGSTVKQDNNSFGSAVPPSTATTSPASIALDNINPTRQKINSLVENLIGKINSTPYNPATDTAYQTYKTELTKDAGRAYKDVNADYLGNQSGNFNSAAQQIASTAQNELINKAALAQGDFEDRFNSKQQRDLSNVSSIVNTLLGIDDVDYKRSRDELSDTRYEDEKNYNRSQETMANTGVMTVDNILAGIPTNSELRNISDLAEAINNEKDPWKKAQLRALRVERINANPVLKAKYGDTAIIPTFQTEASRKTDEKFKIDNANLALDAEYKKAQINNLAADNARADNKAVLSSVKKLTPTQQSSENYNSFISKYQDEDGEDVYNYLNSGSSELKKGSTEYLKAIAFSQNKYYNTIIDRYNQGLYKDLPAILNKGVDGNTNYYRQRLGAVNFNNLVGMANKAKKKSAYDDVVNSNN